MSMMIPVRESSNVVAVGYSAVTKTLTVQFKSGTYDYFDVPPQKWEVIQAAVNGEGSVGSLISSTIVRQHTFRKHEERRDG